jgi:hypothetical protein
MPIFTASRPVRLDSGVHGLFTKVATPRDISEVGLVASQRRLTELRQIILAEECYEPLNGVCGVGGASESTTIGQNITIVAADWLYFVLNKDRLFSFLF